MDKADRRRTGWLEHCPNMTEDEKSVLARHHRKCYGDRACFSFSWGTVTHPGVWACGGARRDLPPVLVGVGVQIPQCDAEEAWLCYIGPIPAFITDTLAFDKAEYDAQCAAIPKRVTRNL